MEVATVGEEDIEDSEVEIINEIECEESQDSSFEFDFDFEEKRSLLLSFVNNYPDVDPKELRSKCESLGYDMKLVQEWLDRNISALPEKKQVQAVARMSLQDQLTGK